MSDLKININGIEEIKDTLSVIIKRLDKIHRPAEQTIFDNNGFQEFLKISASKARKMRDNGKIAFSKDSRTGKIWYKLSDILAYLNSCYYERF